MNCIRLNVYMMRPILSILSVMYVCRLSTRSRLANYFIVKFICCANILIARIMLSIPSKWSVCEWVWVLFQKWILYSELNLGTDTGSNTPPSPQHYYLRIVELRSVEKWKRKKRRMSFHNRWMMNWLFYYFMIARRLWIMDLNSMIRFCDDDGVVAATVAVVVIIVCGWHIWRVHSFGPAPMRNYGRWCVQFRYTHVRACVCVKLNVLTYCWRGCFTRWRIIYHFDFHVVVTCSTVHGTRIVCEQMFECRGKEAETKEMGWDGNDV